MSNPTQPLPTPGGEPTPPPAAYAEAGGHPVRVGGIVWGAVAVTVGILIILTRQLGLNLDAGQSAMWLLFGAGLAMVAGGAVTIARKK
ncbi:hypothetical protein [Specibacter sp. RAF43]|uniref:hypothetical protein n=1 Tax=Specibacter sp. RAF43 TaxID=3233057 RepID=UPI003F9DD6AD